MASTIPHLPPNLDHSKLDPNNVLSTRNHLYNRCSSPEWSLEGITGAERQRGISQVMYREKDNSERFKFGRFQVVGLYISHGLSNIPVLSLAV